MKKLNSLYHSHPRYFISILLVLVLILCGGFYFLWQQNQSSSEKIDPQRDQLSILSGMVYRHLIGYNLVCSEAGSPLQKYPDYFGKKYQAAIQKIGLEWEKRGTSLDTFLIKFDVQIYPSISNDIKKELLELERVVARHFLAYQNNVSVDKIKWNDELEKQMNIKDACIVLDDGAEFFLSNSSFDEGFQKRLSTFK